MEPPILLKPEDVPKDLICPICFTIPTSPPTITPCCQHMYCQPCITQTADTNPTSCPTCRKSCNLHFDMLDVPKGSFIYRMWSNVNVKCHFHDKGCSWTGSIADYAKHMDQQCCAANDIGRSTSMKRLQDAISKKDEEIRSLTMKVSELKQQNETLKDLNQGVKTALNVIHQELSKKNQELNKKNQDDLFDETYAYNRNNVVKLSQLIMRDLESKPPKIDRNKIYDRVRNCYIDLKKGWNDNPSHYLTDVRMLLNTCAASAGWFSDKQFQNIQSWRRETNTQFI